MELFINKRVCDVIAYVIRTNLCGRHRLLLGPLFTIVFYLSTTAQILESSQSTGDPCLERRRFFTTVMIISPEEGLRSLPRRSLYHPRHGCDHNREMRRRHDLNWSCGV
ncbi:hypothetical protein F2Q69_00004968 [Brassica cretica]|uniref:Uncharacterized protein n=1 Tax=Brassica cretica TaxID=69181 RepID=A0A8S9NXX4_BRACR|nr:hypothetical protein F2Q69_00004968 [Brassica cretica]